MSYPKGLCSYLIYTWAPINYMGTPLRPKYNIYIYVYTTTWTLWIRGCYYGVLVSLEKLTGASTSSTDACHIIAMLQLPVCVCKNHVQQCDDATKSNNFLVTTLSMYKADNYANVWAIGIWIPRAFCSRAKIYSHEPSRPNPENKTV